MRAAAKYIFEIMVFFAVVIPFTMYVWPFIKSTLKGSIYAELGFGVVWLILISGVVSALNDVRKNSPSTATDTANNRVVGSLSDDGFRKTKQDYSILQLKLAAAVIVSTGSAIGIMSNRSIDGMRVIVGGVAVYIVLFVAEKLIDGSRRRRLAKQT